MCTEDTLHEEQEARDAMALSRREFNLMALCAAAVASLPGEAIAGDLQSSDVGVKTAAGIADSYFVRPRKGKHPGVLLWADFMSLRPAYRQMADKLARSGYAVLVPNLYYRDAKSPIIEKADFNNKEVMGKIGGYIKQMTAAAVADDAKAYLAFLDQQTSVDTGRKLGTLGYCMGGGYAFRAGAVAPDRVGAVACFHGTLVRDEPESSHHLIPKIKAHTLVAIAAGDDKENPTEKTVLREAFARTGVPAEIEVYEGAKHGWCTPDMVTLYHRAQAERAWGRLLALFQRALRPA
jgi:carboxymethylenebutenolidase